MHALTRPDFVHGAHQAVDPVLFPWSPASLKGPHPLEKEEAERGFSKTYLVGPSDGIGVSLHQALRGLRFPVPEAHNLKAVERVRRREDGKLREWGSPLLGVPFERMGLIPGAINNLRRASWKSGR